MIAEPYPNEKGYRIVPAADSAPAATPPVGSFMRPDGDRESVSPAWWELSPDSVGGGK